MSAPRQERADAREVGGLLLVLAALVVLVVSIVSLAMGCGVSHPQPRPRNIDLDGCWAHRGKFILENGESYVIPDNQRAQAGETRHGRGPRGSDVCGPIKKWTLVR